MSSSDWYESLIPTGLDPRRPCHKLRVKLKLCVLQTDCCRKEGRTPKDCLQAGDVPDECQQLRMSFFECKRSILDMRTRFRGRKGE